MTAQGRTAFVTGANGHLGNQLVKALLALGCRVRASVRDAADRSKTRMLPVDDIELASLDVRDAEAFERACRGIDVVFHAAATYKNVVSSPAEAEEMLRDSIEGARAAVMAAARTQVRRLVFTSSVVTLPFMPRGGRATTEEDWRTDLRVPYHRAKVMAEQEAWRLARQHRVNMVAVLPGAILGPGFVRGTPSTDVIESIMLGGLKNGTPPLNFPAVDIRDVVDGHLLAAESELGGRFIIINDHLPTFHDLGEIVHDIDPHVPRPGRVLPDFMMSFGALFDWINHKTLGAPRTAGPEFVAALRGMEWTMSNRRARTELGWQQHVPLEQSVADTMATLRARTRAPADKVAA